MAIDVQALDALDERLAIAYLAAMATRLLLTLLALLTGLAAQLSPAQARIRVEGASEIGAVSVSALSERAAVIRARTPGLRLDQPLSDRPCSIAIQRSEAPCSPPVMLGIDRAHE